MPILKRCWRYLRFKLESCGEIETILECSGDLFSATSGPDCCSCGFLLRLFASTLRFKTWFYRKGREGLAKERKGLQGSY